VQETKRRLPGRRMKKPKQTIGTRGLLRKQTQYAQYSRFFLKLGSTPGATNHTNIGA
jgi:hypothetical protein